MKKQNLVAIHPEFSSNKTFLTKFLLNGTSNGEAIGYDNDEQKADRFVSEHILKPWLNVNDIAILSVFDKTGIKLFNFITNTDLRLRRTSRFGQRPFRAQRSVHQ